MFWLDSHWQLQHIFNQAWHPAQLLLIVVWLTCAYASWKKPIVSLAIISALLPTYLLRSSFFNIPFTYLELLILTLIFGQTIYLWRYKKLQLLWENFKPYRWPINLIIIGATVGVLISPDITSAAGLWKAYVIEPILLFLIAKIVIATSKDKEIILWSLGFSGLLVSTLAIFQHFTGFAIAQAGWTGETNRRTTSLFTSPNAVGLLLGPLTAIYIAWIFAQKKWLPILFKLGFILIFIVAIFSTKSVGTIVGLIAAISFFLLVNLPKNLRKKIIITLAMLIVLLSAFVSQLEITTKFKQTSLANRLMLIDISQEYLTQNPWAIITGAGILGFAKYQDEVRDPLVLEDLLYPHNIVLNFLFEWGLLGLLGIILIFYAILKKGLTIINSESKQWLAIGILMAFVAILTHGLIDVPYFKNDLAVLFWLLFVLL
jgi:O-antigen ligase